MNDEKAFLRAVCEAPEDDLVRLVFADWLEENEARTECSKCVVRWAGVDLGSDIFGPFLVDQNLRRSCKVCGGAGSISNGFADRAEFIRLQVRFHGHRAIWTMPMEGITVSSHTDRPPTIRASPLVMARLSPDDFVRFTPTDGYGFRVTAVRVGSATEESEIGIETDYIKLPVNLIEADVLAEMKDEASRLYRLHFEDWFPMPGRPLQPCWVDERVSRGFVSEIRTTLSDFLTNANEVFLLHPIERVTLTDRVPHATAAGPDEFAWIADDDADRRSRWFNFLPTNLWRILEYGRGTFVGTAIHYESPEWAYAGLSAACVSHGRTSAGLPPLPASQR